MTHGLSAASRSNIERFLQELNRYISLRNHDVWLNLARGGDIDLLVEDLSGAERAMLLHLGHPLWIARRSYVTGYFYPWGHVDLCPNVEWRGAVYLPNQAVFEMAERPEGERPRPRLGHEALVSWFSSLLWGAFFKGRYRGVILRAAREDAATLRRALTYAAGPTWGERLWQMAAAGRPEASEAHVKAVRRAVRWQAFRRNPSSTLLGWLSFWRAEITLRLLPPIPWVAVLGPDGSGKSSVLTALKDRLAPPFLGVRIQHWRPGFLRFLASSTSVAGPVTNPHGRPPRGSLPSLLKLGFLLVDWMFGYWGCLVHLRARGQLVLFDRYYHDLLIDPTRYRYGGPLWLARFVGRFIPHPDLVILLDAAPEVLRARKQEVSVAETVRQRGEYLKLVHSLANGRVVDASKPLEEVVFEIETILLDHLAERTARRLKVDGKK